MLKSRGLTLIELLAVLSITLILVLIGTPSFSKAAEKARMEGSINTLMRFIYHTRHLAVSENRIITLCAIDDENKCSSDWNEGQLLNFYDANGNKILDADETVYDRVNSFYPAVLLKWSASGGRPYLRYNPLGNVREFGNVLITSNRIQRKLVVNRAGRLYVIDV